VQTANLTFKTRFKLYRCKNKQKVFSFKKIYIYSALKLLTENLTFKLYRCKNKQIYKDKKINKNKKTTTKVMN